MFGISYKFYTPHEEYVKFTVSTGEILCNKTTLCKEIIFYIDFLYIFIAEVSKKYTITSLHVSLLNELHIQEKKACREWMTKISSNFKDEAWFYISVYVKLSFMVGPVQYACMSY